MAEEKKLTLYPGHPEAGYVSPDLSLQDGVGTLPPDEQDAYDTQVADREAEIEAVAQHEHEVASKERETELGESETKTASTKTTVKASSSGS